jgi:hypothetical protein
VVPWSDRPVDVAPDPTCRSSGRETDGTDVSYCCRGASERMSPSTDIITEALWNFSLKMRPICLTRPASTVTKPFFGDG